MSNNNVFTDPAQLRLCITEPGHLGSTPMTTCEMKISAETSQRAPSFPTQRWSSLLLLLFALVTLGTTSMTSLSHGYSRKTNVRAEAQRADPIDGTYWQN